MRTTWTYRPAHERGYANHGWLETRHSFSFALYYDPAHMGFGPLRVINDDRVGPGQGFGEHGHRDMEILSYVIEGALEHRDTLGNGSILKAGQIQLMRAGTGIRHSEFNPSQTETVRFLQVWIKPEQKNLVPGYQEYTLQAESGLELIASSDAKRGALRLHQDVHISALRLESGERCSFTISPGRALWIQVAVGSLALLDDEGDFEMGEGDGLSVENAGDLTLESLAPNLQALLFDIKLPSS